MSVLKLKNGGNILKRTLPIPPTIGNGLKFDGVNDYVQTPFSIDIANDYSFAFIWKPNLYGGNQRILTSFSNLFASNGGFIIAPLNSFGGFKIYFAIYSPIMGVDNCSVYTTNNIPNSLMNVVIVKDTQTRANWKIYINGVLVSVTSFGDFGVAIDTMIGTNLKIGSQINNTQQFFLNANLFDLKIFNKALTQSEVTTLYVSNNNLIPITASANLVANYTFNQKNTPILIGAVLDSSGNNYHGDLINYATPSDVTLGATNSWVDENGNPILV